MSDRVASRRGSESLTTGCGLVECAHDVVWVRGPDTVVFLDGLLSQRIEGTAAGSVVRSLLLAPNGKLRATLFLLPGVDEMGIVADRGSGRTVLEDLERFKIRVDVEVEPEGRVGLELWGPGAPRVLAAAGLPRPDGWSVSPFVASLPFPHTDLPRFLLLGAEAETLAGAGAIPVDRADVEAMRIEQGEAVMGRDVDEGTIPHETGLVAQSVDFDKGCYLGQELVARIDSRGRVNRHLRTLVIETGTVPEPGAGLYSGDDPVGEVTSAVFSAAAGAPVAMALIRREVDPGDHLAVRWGGLEGRAVVCEPPLT
ncbi:MAG: YgfZ/GcvT domain-containing protein [Acidimicrobiia bacterium]